MQWTNRRSLLTAAIATSLVLGGSAAWAGEKEKRNDVVFHDQSYVAGVPDYIEVFKQEGTQGKNYLYTLTFVRLPSGQYCSVITFASETAGTMACADQVPNPEVFRPLDPSKFRER